jgi:hypothetical protein
MRCATTVSAALGCSVTVSRAGSNRSASCCLQRAPSPRGWRRRPCGHPPHSAPVWRAGRHLAGRRLRRAARVVELGPGARPGGLTSEHPIARAPQPLQPQQPSEAGAGTDPQASPPRMAWPGWVARPVPPPRDDRPHRSLSMARGDLGGPGRRELGRRGRPWENGGGECCLSGRRGVGTGTEAAPWWSSLSGAACQSRITGCWVAERRRSQVQPYLRRSISQLLQEGRGGRISSGKGRGTQGTGRESKSEGCLTNPLSTRSRKCLNEFLFYSMTSFLFRCEHEIDEVARSWPDWPLDLGSWHP